MTVLGLFLFVKSFTERFLILNLQIFFYKYPPPLGLRNKFQNRRGEKGKEKNFLTEVPLDFQKGLFPSIFQRGDVPSVFQGAGGTSSQSHREHSIALVLINFQISNFQQDIYWQL